MKKVLILSSMVFIAQAQNGSQLAIEQQQMLQTAKGSVSVKNALNPVARPLVIGKEIKNPFDVRSLRDLSSEEEGDLYLLAKLYSSYDIRCLGAVAPTYYRGSIGSFKNPALNEESTLLGAPVRCYVIPRNTSKTHVYSGSGNGNKYLIARIKDAMKSIKQNNNDSVIKNATVEVDGKRYKISCLEGGSMTTQDYIATFDNPTVSDGGGDQPTVCYVYVRTVDMPSYAVAGQASVLSQL